MPAIANTGIVTATWRESLASRGISSGPKRCNDGCRASSCSVLKQTRYEALKTLYRNHRELRRHLVELSNRPWALGDSGVRDWFRRIVATDGGALGRPAMAVQRCWLAGWWCCGA